MTQYTTAEVAAKFETTPRTLRKFLRADAKNTDAETPGKGSRYAIEGKALNPMKKRFNAWSKAQAEEKAQRDAEKATVSLEKEPIDGEDTNEEIEPTDAELAELDEMALDD